MQGLVKAVGVSNYGPRQLERIHTYLERRGIPLASAQACCMQARLIMLGAVPFAMINVSGMRLCISATHFCMAPVHLVGKAQRCRRLRCPEFVTWRAQVQFSLISKGPQQMQTKALCDQLGIQLIAYSPLGLGAHVHWLHCMVALHVALLWSVRRTCAVLPSSALLSSLARAAWCMHQPAPRVGMPHWEIRLAFFLGGKFFRRSAMAETSWTPKRQCAYDGRRQSAYTACDAQAC